MFILGTFILLPEIQSSILPISFLLWCVSTADLGIALPVKKLVTLTRVTPKQILDKSQQPLEAYLQVRVCADPYHTVHRAYVFDSICTSVTYDIHSQCIHWTCSVVPWSFAGHSLDLGSFRLWKAASGGYFHLFWAWRKISQALPNHPCCCSGWALFHMHSMFSKDVRTCCSLSDSFANSQIPHLGTCFTCAFAGLICCVTVCLTVSSCYCA